MDISRLEIFDWVELIIFDYVDIYKFEDEWIFLKLRCVDIGIIVEIIIIIMSRYLFFWLKVWNSIIIEIECLCFL